MLIVYIICRLTLGVTHAGKYLSPNQTVLIGVGVDGIVRGPYSVFNYQGTDSNIIFCVACVFVMSLGELERGVRKFINLAGFNS